MIETRPLQTTITDTYYIGYYCCEQSYSMRTATSILNVGNTDADANADADAESI